MAAYLTCGAKWCSPCPNGWTQDAACHRSEEFLDQAEEYGRAAQAALDAYDLAFPEDFLSAYREYGLDGEGDTDGPRSSD